MGAAICDGVVVGPNGAEKSSCVHKAPISDLLPNVRFLNPDNVTLEKLIALGYSGFVDAPVDVQTKLFIESANEVQVCLEAAIENGEHVGIETVLSTEKYHRAVNRVIELNGRFQLLYIAVHSPAISQARVANRVAHGGHGIPDDKIEARFYRSLRTLPWHVSRAHSFWVVDNSNTDPSAPLKLLAMGRDGRIVLMSEDTFSALKSALVLLV